MSGVHFYTKSLLREKDEIVQVVDAILATNLDHFLLKWCVFSMSVLASIFVSSLKWKIHKKTSRNSTGKPPPRTWKIDLGTHIVFLMYFGNLFSNLVAPIGAIWPPFSCLFVPFAPLWFTFGYLLAPFGSFLAPFRVPSRYFGPELRATSYLDGFFQEKKNVKRNKCGT